MTKKASKNKRRGFSLVEMSIVLAIMGGVIATIWVVSSNVREEERENEAFTELQTIAHNITVLKQTQGPTAYFTAPFGGNITDIMINAGAIPRTYVNPTNPARAVTPWTQGDLFIFPKLATSFRITFTSTSYRGCLALLLQGTACTAGDPECPTEIHTNGAIYTLMSNGGGNWLAYNPILGWKNMTPTQAEAACNANTPADSTVEFDYVF